MDTRRSSDSRSLSPHMARSRKRTADGFGLPGDALSTPLVASSALSPDSTLGILDTPSARVPAVRADDLLFAPVGGWDDDGAIDDRGGKRRRLLPVPSVDGGTRLAGKVLSTALDAAIVRRGS